MLKEVKKWGNTLLVSFTPEERRVYDLQDGAVIDLEIKSVQQKKRKR